MKLYWPIALACSAVGCIVLMPIAWDVEASQIFVGVEHVPYALGSGALMALITRRFFERSSWAWAMAMSGIFGIAHVCVFGVLVGLVKEGGDGALRGLFLAPKLSLDKFYIFLPLCFGAHAAIKWSANQEVDNISILD